MTLIKSISGIRGTIGGQTSENLTPIDAVKFAAAYGTFIKKRNPSKNKISVVCQIQRFDLTAIWYFFNSVAKSNTSNTNTCTLRLKPL